MSPASPAPRTVDLVLASASPRRRALLERLGLTLLVAPTDIDETRLPGEAPRDYVVRVAGAKCDAAVARLATSAHASANASANAADASTAAPAVPVIPVLAADTAVTLAGEIFGKPVDAADAARMLDKLAGRRHEVITAYRIRHGGTVVERAVATTVTFRLIEPAEAAAYVASGEWRDKAGGYAVQGIAAAFVTEVKGSITSVIGLPLAEVIADLRAAGGLGEYPRAAFGIEASATADAR